MEQEEEEDLRSESMDNVAAALGSLDDDEARSRELPMLSPPEQDHHAEHEDEDDEDDENEAGLKPPPKRTPFELQTRSENSMSMKTMSMKRLPKRTRKARHMAYKV